MTTLELLVRARARLTEPEQWTKGANSRRRDGSRVPSADPAACCWCIIGALWAEAATFDAVAEEAFAALQRALPRGQRCVADFNDHHATTLPDIHALFDRAIAALREAA